MQIINKWDCQNLSLVLFKNENGARKNTYGIDINDNLSHETAYYYEFKKQKEAEKFFDTMWRHIFTK